MRGCHENDILTKGMSLFYQTGTYHCVASNPCGSVVVQEVELVRARLEIRRVDGGSLDDDFNASRQRGKSLTLNLAEEIIVDSQPPPTISWFEFSASHSPSNEIFDTRRRAVSVARDVAALLDLESNDDGHLVRVKFENPTAGITQESPRWLVKVRLDEFSGASGLRGRESTMHIMCL